MVSRPWRGCQLAGDLSDDYIAGDPVVGVATHDHRWPLLGDETLRKRERHEHHVAPLIAGHRQSPPGCPIPPRRRPPTASSERRSPLDAPAPPAPGPAPAPHAA